MGEFHVSHPVSHPLATEITFEERTLDRARVRMMGRVKDLH